MKKRKTDIHFAIKKETTTLQVGFFHDCKTIKEQERCNLMVADDNEYCINKWMAVIFALAIIISLIAFYLWNGPLNNHVPFYEQMDCKSLGNLILDQGSFDEMLRHYEETCTNDISYDRIFDK